jgi:hypothetical protein
LVPPLAMVPSNLQARGQLNDTKTERQGDKSG